MFDIGTKNRPQKFFHWKFRLFFSKIWFFINLLGPKELILLLPQYFSEYLLDFYTSSLEVCHTRYYEKKRHRNIFSLEILPFFFRKFVISTTSQVLKECSYKFYSKGQISFWPFKKVSWLLSCPIVRRKRGPNFLSPENIYFLRRLFLSTSNVPKKWWYLLHNNCQNTFRTLLNCFSPTFSRSIIGEKMGHKFFFVGKVAFFSQKVVFSSTSYVIKRTDLTTSIVTAKTPYGPL